MRYSELTIKGSKHLNRDLCHIHLKPGLMYPRYRHLLDLSLGKRYPEWYPQETKNVRGSRLFLARDNGNIIGWLLYAPYDYDYQIQVYVRSRFRRQGIGGHLMKMAIRKWAREQSKRRPPKMYHTAYEVFDRVCGIKGLRRIAT